jgi:hypothetical protein
LSTFSRPPFSQTAPIKTRTNTMPFTCQTPLKAEYGRATFHIPR